MEKGPLPSLEEIQNITDINEAKALLLASINYEQKIEQELEFFLKDSTELERKLTSVEDIPIKLGPVYREAKRLSSTISDTCNLAEAVSSKVRELDVTRERLKHTLSKLHDIIDVKNCVNGVQKAMEVEDYETAASHIQRYLNIDKSVLEDSASQQLKASEQKLREIVRRKLEASIRADDHTNILRFCKLYTPLGLKEEGLTAYSHYLRRLIAAEAEYVIKHLVRAGDSNSFKVDAEALMVCDGLSRFFEFIAQLVEEKRPLVEENFGESGMLTVIINLQQECDIHGAKILNAFIADNQISKIVDEIVKARKRTTNRGLLSNSKNVEAPIIEPRELADLLDNIAVVNQRTELYDRFMRAKAMKAKGALEEELKAQHEGTNEGREPIDAAQARQLLMNPVLHCSDLKKKVQEMMGDYIALEEYFMVQSVKKAVGMDEHLEDSLTSSMVDYVFFVLKKSTQRVMSTRNIDTVCAIINLINASLNIEYKEVLQNMLAEYSQGKGPNADQKTDYMLVLNNLEVSSEYILKLKGELEAECHIFTEPNQREKIKSCLHDLTETSKTFKQLLQSNLEQVAQTNTPSIRPLIDMFVQVNYTLEEAEYAENEINDPFVQKFVGGLENLFLPFKSHLTESNYDSLVHIVIRMIVHRLEKAVLQKKFNQLGALQFDKDLRILVGYFSGVMQKTVRGEFARLNQMASILNLEKVNEVMDYWGENSGQMTWRLTPGEVRKVLSRRVEFKSNEIAQLKL